jgi:hypothetical protein
MIHYNFLISGHQGERNYIMDVCNISLNENDESVITKIYQKLAHQEIELRKEKKQEEPG